MKSYEDLNIEQVGSESDPFTLERYRHFSQHFPKSVKNVLDVGCNTGRGGRVLKQLNPNLFLAGLDCVQSRLDRIE